MERYSLVPAGRRNIYSSNFRFSLIKIPIWRGSTSRAPTGPFRPHSSPRDVVVWKLVIAEGIAIFCLRVGYSSNCVDPHPTGRDIGDKCGPVIGNFVRTQSIGAVAETTTLTCISNRTGPYAPAEGVRQTIHQPSTVGELPVHYSPPTSRAEGRGPAGPRQHRQRACSNWRLCTRAPSMHTRALADADDHRRRRPRLPRNSSHGHPTRDRARSGTPLSPVPRDSLVAQLMEQRPTTVDGPRTAYPIERRFTFATFLRANSSADRR